MLRKHISIGVLLIIGYARISTPDQSLDGQRDALREAGCERIGEETASGKRGAIRPVWDETIRHLRRGDTLMVTELSRLGRSTSELAKFADDLQVRGVALRILNLGLDTTTPAGQLIYSIIAAVAQMERDLLIERTQRGLTAARARGRYGGRPPKLTAKQIKAAQALRDSGKLTMSEIAEQMGVARGTLYRHLAV
jgi:DNA invertase Pin-like site-specific DNA recombinase